jgi:hypothetical protein
MTAVFKSGAKRSEVKPRYDLIPLIFLDALADHCGKGTDKWGCANWQKGGDDFIKDAYNHMTGHALKASQGMTDENHLIATAWNAMAIYVLEQRRKQEALEPGIEFGGVILRSEPIKPAILRNREAGELLPIDPSIF